MYGPGATRSGAGCRPEGAEGAPAGADEAAGAVEAVLTGRLGALLEEARRVDEVFAEEVAGRVAAFVLRGGKRLRTAFVWCGWLAAGGGGDPDTPVRIGAALELLQACALVHDDVMDESPVRRGAPAVHAEFARLHRAAGIRGSAASYSASAAVLAGDLALAWADDLLTETALASEHGDRLHREWQALRGEMVAGQYLDLRAQAAGSSDPDEAMAVATLKSALYTVGRPLALGAVAAGADAGTADALRAAGRSAGLAFQLRDDLLGAFGDPARTGKPADGDLRGRKLTYLLAVAVRRAAGSGDSEALALLAPAREPAGGVPVDRMREALERTGARAAVEEEIASLAASSLRQFAAGGADARARREFARTVARAVDASPAAGAGRPARETGEGV
ncbi:polyprenyl synthetase family protein [Streptomyces nitrosporeus]|uniref:Polyprenyl synthetase family protein n=1 Tax=Streptomyces nitrosporeus TaxID=28894 RepID=A0A5J6F5P5_9ACTN|nr:polyprenyl synthetase family protein [Streptomyces nitrosporeus]QEU71618.1 polyprenyl synthetase family protein [Streptomyces nitrosporeus]GGZ27614.1 geranylgeranyl pyrophosphate synthase [Streptomyces nitrosporeus]